MTDIEQHSAAKQFAADWQGRGDEKQDTQRFWLSMLQNVYFLREESFLHILPHIASICNMIL